MATRMRGLHIKRVVELQRRAPAGCPLLDHEFCRRQVRELVKRRLSMFLWHQPTPAGRLFSTVSDSSQRVILPTSQALPVGTIAAFPLTAKQASADVAAVALALRPAPVADELGGVDRQRHPEPRQRNGVAEPGPHRLPTEDSRKLADGAYDHGN